MYVISIKLIGILVHSPDACLKAAFSYYLYELGQIGHLLINNEIRIVS